MYNAFKSHLTKELQDIKDAGLYKQERIITTPQSACIDTTKANGVLNFCANNYLGLSNDEELKKVAMESYEKYGKGVVGVNEVPEELIRLYCTLDVSPIEGEDRAMTCRRIIEKPAPDQILSLFAILGRVVLPPETFELIEKGLANTPEGEE